MDAWCRELKPQLFQPGAAGRQIGIGWLAVFEKHQLRNIAAHGMKDLASGAGSYFRFFRIPGNLTPATPACSNCWCRTCILRWCGAAKRQARAAREKSSRSRSFRNANWKSCAGCKPAASRHTPPDSL